MYIYCIDKKVQLSIISYENLKNYNIYMKYVICVDFFFHCNRTAKKIILNFDTHEHVSYHVKRMLDTDICQT